MQRGVPQTSLPLQERTVGTARQKTVHGKGEEPQRRKIPKLELIKTNECVTLRPFTLFYGVL